MTGPTLKTKLFLKVTGKVKVLMTGPTLKTKLFLSVTGKVKVLVKGPTLTQTHPLVPPSPPIPPSPVIRNTLTQTGGPRGMLH